MGFCKGEMLFLCGTLATMVAANAWSGGWAHPAAGNPHPAAGNPHPADFGNPHPAGEPPSYVSGLGLATASSGDQDRRGGTGAAASTASSPGEETWVMPRFIADRGPAPGGTIRGFNPNPVRGFNPSPVTGFNPNPIKGFNPSPVTGFNHNPFKGRNSSSGFADGLSPFPSFPGFTASVPGPMAQDLRELIIDERGVKVFRLRRVKVAGGSAAAAGAGLVTNQTLNTASPLPPSGF